jgi:poly-gamma-glutamate capsule biosynthesis protein CapA/YwtB (metallophosphatase superfamily)
MQQRDNVMSFFSKGAVVLAALVGLVACQSPIVAKDKAWMQGRVVDAEGEPLQADILIGQARYETDAQGRFSFTPAPALVYKLEVEAEGHYAMRHTFSHAELVRTATLPDIVLVEQKQGRTLFVFGGDAMIARRYYDPHPGEPILVRDSDRLADSQALLAEMKPYLERADYASINLETPVFSEPPSEPAPKSVTFFSAPETLKALEWAGTDYVALGNNHIYDYLEPGQALTLDLLAQSALDYSGAGEDEEEALKPHRESIDRFNYDFLSYVGWPAGPPTQSAAADKGGAALGTRKNLVQTTRLSRAENAIPILQFHGGLEYVEDPTLSVETRLKSAIDAGAALVVGHHPHVTQGLEVYKDKLIAWSLGNFLFDQYFYSAQSAALLYVWMDGDEFYHAEAVPLYLKGYMPTPAVGPMRTKINQRMYQLSKQRGTYLRRSGGHLVVGRDTASVPSALTFESAYSCEAGRARFGVDLLARGDFDSYALFDAPDRSWLDLEPAVQITANEADPFDYEMKVNLSDSAGVTTGMRKFTRVFKKGTPMSVRMSATATKPVQVDVFLQTRADGQPLFEALEQGARTRIGSKTLSPGTSQALSFEFDSPRTRARSIRFLIELHADRDAAVVTIDDLELIEWQTPFVENTEFCAG